MLVDAIETESLIDACTTMATKAKRASRSLANAPGEVKNRWLLRSASALRASADRVFEANRRDVEAAPGHGLNASAIDRLTLNPARLESIASSLEQIAALPDPVGEVIEAGRRPNGLELSKVRVPLGVIFMMYESRPNVTVDAAALCVKSGNAAILRGGKEARESNLALHGILDGELAAAGLPEGAVQYVDRPEREAVGILLGMPDLIDLAIPRGGEGLIRRVVAEARMPVLKHYLGNCHVYVDEAADIDMAVSIVDNAKTQRPGVCNAAETLLVHRGIADRFLPKAAEVLVARGVELRGDPESRALVPSMTPATEDDWGTEYADLILAVAVVDSIESAIEHIDRYGSGHTEAIVTADLRAARRFVAEVDSAAVLVNASTRFNDGGELGLGAEIGISTDKFHARGPCGLRELTTSKWIVFGDGHVRA